MGFRYTDNQISTLGNLPLTILNQLDKDSSLIPVFNDCLDLPGLVNLWNSGDEVYWKDDQDVYYRSRRYTSTCTCLQDLNPEILVDMSQYTKGSEYSMISYFEVIGDLVAFGLDTTGTEFSPTNNPR